MDYQLVYDFLAMIPKGKVVTYKVIAQEFGIHPRFVARILSKNYDGDTFPCYKVICSDGKLGGYTHQLGIQEKIRRLTSDGIEIVDGKIDRKYVWKE